MSRNASGTYSLPAGQPVVTGTVISAATFNTLTSDVSTEITDSLSRSGKGGMSSALVLNSAVAVGTPDLSFTGDTDTGLYRIGANNFGLACAGAKVVDVATTGIAVTGTLSASGVTSIADGAVGTPGLNFTTDTDCGLYRIGANDIAITVGGVKQFELTTAAATIVQNTTVSGTLTSTGAFVASSSANVVGAFSVNTNKFTVAAASGNTVVAGTLNVTGAGTLAGGLTITDTNAGSGLTVTGGTGAGAHGITATGGGTSGAGGAFTGTGGFQGVQGTGQGAGAGAGFTGGATAGAPGLTSSGGAGGGNGAQLTATGTYAPLNLVVVTSTPTTLANGDMWIENVGGTWHFKIRMNGATSTIV